MKMFEIALFVVCIQIGGGLVSLSGLFGDSIYYENKLGTINFPNNMSASSELEQNQISYTSFKDVMDALTWDWVTKFFGEAYNNDTDTKIFADHVVTYLNWFSGIVIGAAILEFFRNRIQVI